MNNGQIAYRLSQIATLLELTEEDFFKVRAYRNAADAVARFQMPIIEKGRLHELQGIGRGISKVIRDLVRTGTSPILTELQEKLPGELPLMLQIPGIGPKSIKRIYQNYKSERSMNWSLLAKNIGFRR
ncbi:hypothetical protein [Effusibacillus consociatus]|uniref:Crossover junction endonuclease MUS81-like HHH domain-containing protein n=1 Tax=Effusibacillus consociatus TaxID=1117041 RepID=A0ABV9PZP5_9BACL